ncbi:MAG: molybdopterin molybdotransferase MoeA [Campylobacterales bacterium]
MVGFYEALEALEAQLVYPSAKESVFISSAFGRTLAEDIKASENSPAFNTSAMDGYAIKCSDMGSDIVIKGFIQAGSDRSYELKRGEAYKIFTGALIPDGADAVVKVEECRDSDGKLIIERDSVKEYENIRRVGDSYKKGDVLLSQGTKVGAVEVGLIASLGVSEVDVFRLPSVGVVSFGEELLSLSAKKQLDSQKYSSNNYALCAYIQDLGAKAYNLGVVKDNFESSKRVIVEALKSYDVVVTTGGMSKGDFDFIQEILKEIDAKEVFKGVKMKPGKPIGVYKKDSKFIIGLPGFPNSAFVTFSLFGKPIIKALLGQNHEFITHKGVLKESVRKSGDRFEFRPAEAYYEDGRLTLSFSSKKSNSSAIINNLVGSSALAMLPKEGEYIAGSEVDVYMFKSIGV